MYGHGQATSNRLPRGILVTLANRRLWIRRLRLAALRPPRLRSNAGVESVMFELVFMFCRCRKCADEWKNRAETAVTVEERSRHLMVAEHYSALAANAERSMRAAWDERFPRMRTA